MNGTSLVSVPSFLTTLQEALLSREKQYGSLRVEAPGVAVSDITVVHFVQLGQFFSWVVRLDRADEGRIRIVYESADLRLPIKSSFAERLCVKRFPAAQFQWEVGGRSPVQFLQQAFYSG